MRVARRLRLPPRAEASMWGHGPRGRAFRRRGLASVPWPQPVLPPNLAHCNRRTPQSPCVARLQLCRVEPILPTEDAGEPLLPHLLATAKPHVQRRAGDAQGSAGWGAAMTIETAAAAHLRSATAAAARPAAGTTTARAVRAAAADRRGDGPRLLDDPRPRREGDLLRRPARRAPDRRPDRAAVSRSSMRC